MRLFKDRRLSGTGSTKRVAAMRWLITLVCLATFSFQSFATQTHIHPHEIVVAQSIANADYTFIADGSGGTSDEDDEAHCPYCQAVAHTGSFLSVGPFTITAHVTRGVLAPLPVAICIGCYRSHSWDSRGPPQA